MFLKFLVNNKEFWIFRGIAEENEFGSKDLGFFCNWRFLWFFGNGLCQIARQNFAFANDIFPSNGVLVFYRTIVSWIHDFEE